MRPKGQIFDLKQFRHKYKLTQKEISEAVNRPQSFLSAIEHGKRAAPPAFLDDLTRLYNVDNISDFLLDREEAPFGSVADVKKAIVNSPGGVMLLNEFGNRLTPKEIQRILEIEQLALHKEQAQKEPTPQPEPAPAPPSNLAPSDGGMMANMVKMLSEAQARYFKAEDRIRELEKQVEDLQAQLKKRRK